MEIMEFHKDKISVIISPIYISKAGCLNRFLLKSQFYGPSVPIKPAMTMIIAAAASQFVVWRDQK